MENKQGQCFRYKKVAFHIVVLTGEYINNLNNYQFYRLYILNSLFIFNRVQLVLVLLPNSSYRNKGYQKDEEGQSDFGNHCENCRLG